MSTTSRKRTQECTCLDCLAKRETQPRETWMATIYKRATDTVAVVMPATVVHDERFQNGDRVKVTVERVELLPKRRGKR